MNFSSSWSFALVGGPFCAPSAFLPPIMAQLPAPVTARVAIDSYADKCQPLSVRIAVAQSVSGRMRSDSLEALERAGERTQCEATCWPAIL